MAEEIKKAAKVVKAEDFYDFYQKLNYRCEKGKYVADSFKCGNTPEEAKKNYQKEQKEKKAIGRDKSRTKNAVRATKTATKQLKKVTDPKLAQHVTNVKGLMDKIKAEKASGTVSKETFKAFKAAMQEFRTAKSGIGGTGTPKPQVGGDATPTQAIEPKPLNTIQPSKAPDRVSVVNSDYAVDQMQVGDVWNAGLMGDIKVESVSDNDITVTANNFTETMPKSALKKALKEYNVTKNDNIISPIVPDTKKEKNITKQEISNVPNTDKLNDIKAQIDELRYKIKSEEENDGSSDIGDSVELDNLKGDYWVKSHQGKLFSPDLTVPKNKFIQQVEDNRKNTFSQKPIITAVKNTKGAKITENGLELTMVRYQEPEMDGVISPRDGVFFLPSTSGNGHDLYTDTNTAFGGSEKIVMKATFSNPLMVMGSTGGPVPERAYKAIEGEDKYNELDKAIWDCQSKFTGFRLGYRGELMKVQKNEKKTIKAIAETLEKYGGDPSYAKEMYDHGYAKRDDGGADPILYFTMREHIFGQAVKKAGYDSIIGYDDNETDENSLELTEVFDLRTNKNPAKDTKNDKEYASSYYDNFYDKGSKDTNNKKQETIRLVEDLVQRMEAMQEPPETNKNVDESVVA
jgi:hypothetical protein